MLEISVTFPFISVQYPVSKLDLRRIFGDFIKKGYGRFDNGQSSMKTTRKLGGGGLTGGNHHSHLKNTCFL